MNKQLWLSVFLLVFLLLSCNGGGGSFNIKGEFKNLQDGEFYVFSTDPLWNGFDTIHVAEGSFKFSHPLEDTTLIVFQYPNFMQMYAVAIPGNTLKMKGNANSLSTMRITGNEDNELYTDFRLSILQKSSAEILKMAETFIRKHPANYASQAVLLHCFVDVENPDYTKIQSLLGVMQKAAPWRVSLKSLQSSLRPLLRCRVGSKLPAFSAVTMKGDTVNNKSLKSHYALISFWSTWSTRFLSPVQSQRQLLKPYLKQLRVVNISLDTDTAEVKRQVKRDSIPGIMVCDQLSWQSPLVHTFGLRSLPSNLLVNPQGVIMKRDLDEESLKTELPKIFHP